MDLLTCHSEPVTDVTGVGIRVLAIGATLAVARTVYDGAVGYRCGAMHPKGTCSASLHCVGIAPYEILSEVAA